MLLSSKFTNVLGQLTKAGLLAACMAATGCYSPPPSPAPYSRRFDHASHFEKARSLGVLTPKQENLRIGMGIASAYPARQMMARTPGEGMVESVLKQRVVDYEVNPRIRQDIDDALAGQEISPHLRQQFSTALGTILSGTKIDGKIQTRAAIVHFMKTDHPELWESTRLMNSFWSVLQRQGVLTR